MFGLGAIKQLVKRKIDLPMIETSLTRLSSRGFEPNLIFDVGAYKGEFAELCLKIWRKPSVVCFEALESGLSRLREMESAKQITIVEGLVGSQAKENVPFNEMETASSVLEEHSGHNISLKCHPMRTLDSVIEERFPDRMVDLLKIDTQGYEMEIFKGIEKNISKVRVILVELNLIDIHKGVSLFHEVIGWLAERGFVAYDICALTRRPLDKALWQADLIFVQINDPLRTDKRWQP